MCVCVFRGENGLGDIKHGWRGVGRINKVQSRKAALQTLRTQRIGPGSTVFIKILGLQRETDKEWEEGGGPGSQCWGKAGIQVGIEMLSLLGIFSFRLIFVMRLIAPQCKNVLSTFTQNANFRYVHMLKIVMYYEPPTSRLHWGPLSIFMPAMERGIDILIKTLSSLFRMLWKLHLYLTVEEHFGNVKKIAGIVLYDLPAVQR